MFIFRPDPPLFYKDLQDIFINIQFLQEKLIESTINYSLEKQDTVLHSEKLNQNSFAIVNMKNNVIIDKNKKTKN